MKLIDADALEYESIDSCDTGRHESYYGTGILAIRKEDIDNAPTIEERKKGKWHGRFYFYPKIEMIVCSECQHEYSYDAETGERDYNFCPNCGADMRGEEDE